MDLIALGFAPDTAKFMTIAAGELGADEENVRLNAQLLKKYMDLKAIPKNQGIGAAVFLRRPYAENQFMASVPERYAFSEKQKKEYMSDILCNWMRTEDFLSTEPLRDVMGEERMEIYRKAYLNIAWVDGKMMKRIADEIAGIAPSKKAASDFIERYAFLLFSEYSQTLPYLSEVKKAENPWMELEKTILDIPRRL